MHLSCLVISRTPALLNRLLKSLPAARSQWQTQDEVLCSWNGTTDDEAFIATTSAKAPGEPPHFRIAQREAYHFATNMNSLGRLATGELVLLINDDVILDPGSLDRAIDVLMGQPDAGVVGGLLRTSSGRLGHAGILFGENHLPYNRCRPELAPMISLTSAEVRASGAIPAVTGALMLMRRSDLLAVPLRESFQQCGEDVALCLDLRHQLGKTAYYSSTITAIHNEKSTRGKTTDASDLQAVASIARKHFASDSTLLALQHHWQAREASWITELALQQFAATTQAERTLLEHEAHWQHREAYWQQRETDWQHIQELLIAQREELRQRLLATWSSASWKITRPLRFLGQLWRRFYFKPTP